MMGIPEYYKDFPVYGQWVLLCEQEEIVDLVGCDAFAVGPKFHTNKERLNRTVDVYNRGTGQTSTKSLYRNIKGVYFKGSETYWNGSCRAFIKDFVEVTV